MVNASEMERAPKYYCKPSKGRGWHTAAAGNSGKLPQRLESSLQQFLPEHQNFVRRIGPQLDLIAVHGQDHNLD